MKKTIFIILFLSLLFFIQESLFAFQNEPDGFKGIKWGTDISTLHDMQFDRLDTTQTSYSGLSIYRKPGEKFSVGDMESNNIDYYFYKGKLIKVEIWFTCNDSQFDQLQKYCSSIYKEGQKTKEFYWLDPEVRCFWMGDTTRLNLSKYDSSPGTSNTCSLSFISVILKNQLKNEKNANSGK